MMETAKKINKDEINKYLFIMDNCSCHLTSELFKFYHENNLKILFGVSYLSKFNFIEYVFRFIKNITHKRSYETSYNPEKDIKNIIENGVNENFLKKLFKDILLEYKKFIDKNNNIHLNVI